MLPYSRQTIEADDIEAVAQVLQSDMLTCGRQVELFESELAAYCGSRFAVACSSGTAALHLAGLALGWKAGDSVITSPITFMASSNAALYCGADPLFSEIDPSTACLDPQALRKTLQTAPNVRAVIPVHYGGGVADMASIARLAQGAGAAVIEDACHALGSSYADEDGRRVKVGSCRHSAMTVFSFHPLKAITTGEGGAITTNDETLYRQLTSLRSHGIVRESARWEVREQGFEGDRPNPWYHEMQALGFNYRLTDIQCALGRSQLRKLDRFVSRRQQIAALYRRELAGTKSPVGVLFAEDDVGNSHHLFPALLPEGASRGEVMRRLSEFGIHTQVHYIPVPLQPFYRNRGTAISFPRAEAFYARALSLPVFPMMKDADVAFVVEKLNGALGS
ncbi:UDP-4-amino-4,6-dideoxy-N-acetyl-beta-L-altrosamine transaminase [bacterium]|nr:UDP-4-amino-4,6-dideoxy-N-acetyl-beta-L-altrosamine transaminase [bacterium]